MALGTGPQFTDATLPLGTEESTAPFGRTLPNKGGAFFLAGLLSFVVFGFQCVFFQKQLAHFSFHFLNSFSYAFLSVFLFDDRLGGGKKCFFLVKQHLFHVGSVPLGKKDKGEMISQKLSRPLFVAVGVHTSWVGFAQYVGFTTGAADFKTAVWTSNTYPGRLVVGICANVTGHGSGKILLKVISDIFFKLC
jgi:hypothetical protein